MYIPGAPEYKVHIPGAAAVPGAAGAQSRPWTPHLPGDSPGEGVGNTGVREGGEIYRGEGRGRSIPE